MRKKIIIGIVFCFVVLFSGFFIWASDTLKAGEVALKALEGTESVVVEHNKYIKFIPKIPSEKGVIFYPGGKVSPKAYSEIMLATAEEGFFSVIVAMPLNLAVFSPNKADEVMRDFPEIKEWYIIGHSLGGAMACQYVKEHKDDVQGLILLASYPASSSDLADESIDVLSIHASEDGLSTVEKVNNAKAYLPENTQYVLIEGGNHAQFGDYGKQAGDGEAEITQFEQMQRVKDEMIKFMTR